MKMRALCILFCLGLVSALYADQESKLFRVVTSAQSIKELKYDFKGESKDIFVQGWMSQPYPMPNGTLSLYRLIPPPPNSPVGTPPSPEIIANFNIPETMSRALVVLIRNDSGKYFARLFDDSYEVHPAGKVRMINFSSMNAAINIKGETGQAASGESTLIPYGSGPLRVKVAVENSDKWEIAFQKGRISYPNIRAYSLVFDYDIRLLPDPSITPPAALVRFYTERAPILE